MTATLEPQDCRHTRVIARRQTSTLPTAIRRLRYPEQARTGPGNGKGLADHDDRQDLVNHSLKQIQTGLAVTGDGGIPLLSRVLDGGAAEISQITGTMNSLRAMAGPKEFLLIADSKLISYGNVTALIKAGTDFIAPAPASKVHDAVYAALDLEAATVVDYTPARDEDTPTGARETYRVLEDTHLLAGPRKSNPPLEVRRILVHSTGNAKGRQRAREKRLAKAREDLDKLQLSAGGRYYNTAEKIAARIGMITRTRRVSGCLHTEITTDDTGRPALSWHFDQDVLQAEAAVDGWYALLTTLTPEQADPSEVLRRHKGQGAVERRYGDFKGPLAVTPIFVQDNKRVAALIAVICLALLLFCLIERQVRRALGPDQRMRSIYPGNQAVRPTGRMILYHLSDLRLRVTSATDPPVIAITRGIHSTCSTSSAWNPHTPVGQRP